MIRRFRGSDVDAFAAYRAAPDVARYQGWGPSYTTEEGVGFVAKLAGTDPGTAGDWFQFALEQKAEPSLAGDCGLRIDGHVERVGMRRIETRRVDFKDESCDEHVYEVELPLHPQI